MKRISLNILFFLSVLILYQSDLLSQNWFPLEIGNRWDYSVGIDYPGGFAYDTLSMEIVDEKILSNGLEYFEFSIPFPLWYSLPYPKFVREENNNIYFFNEEDSADCFAFRFDLPADSFYINCKDDELNVIFKHNFIVFGIYDTIQEQSLSWPYIYRFSRNFGIYHYSNVWGLSRYYYDLEGCIISDVTYGNLLVSVGNKSQSPNVFTLSQNYPNPFNPSTIIKFTISDLRFTILKVYDLLGREVATLVNEEKPAGNYEVEFFAIGGSASGGNAFTLPSGIYFYRLRAGDYIETKKMVLLK